jgi:hypothetical protein
LLLAGSGPGAVEQTFQCSNRNTQKLAESYGRNFTGPCRFIGGIPAKPKRRTSLRNGHRQAFASHLRSNCTHWTRRGESDIENDVYLHGIIYAVNITCDAIWFMLLCAYQ